MVESYCISKESLRNQLINSKEAIRLGEINVIYFLPLLRKILTSLTVFPGPQLWACSRLGSSSALRMPRSPVCPVLPSGMVSVLGSSFAECGWDSKVLLFFYA